MTLTYHLALRLQTSWLLLSHNCITYSAVPVLNSLLHPALPSTDQHQDPAERPTCGLRWLLSSLSRPRSSGSFPMKTSSLPIKYELPLFEFSQLCVYILWNLSTCTLYRRSLWVWLISLLISNLLRGQTLCAWRLPHKHSLFLSLYYSVILHILLSFALWLSLTHVYRTISQKS